MQNASNCSPVAPVQAVKEAFDSGENMTTASNAREQEVKEFIISTLDLEDITPEQIDVEAPIFGDGLGLDSIDALELGVALSKKYSITMEADSEETKGHFASVRALASYIEKSSVPE